MSKLAKQILRLLEQGYSKDLLFAPTTLHAMLKTEGVGCTKKQVKQALKRHFVHIYETFTGLRVADSDTFLRAIRAGYNTPFWCVCGNPAEHDKQWCEKAIAYEKDFGRNYYHCDACRLYGDDRYADPHGIVWVNGITACELNRQIVAQTQREDAQMRRDMAYCFAR